MSGNGLDLAKGAVRRWRGEHGDESLYLQCDRFDGFYTGAEWQGNWDVIAYPSAQESGRAAQAGGFMYTSDVNDPRVKVGDRVYYDWENSDHICHVIGRDGNRTVVTNTANSGDDLGQLGNHVKISHADTIGLTVIGISRRHGTNREITGVDLWQLAAPTPQPIPAGQDDWIKLDGWAWYESADDAMRMRNPHGPKWTGEPLLYGERDVLGIEANGSIRLAARDGSTIWVHGSARGLIFYKAGNGAPAAPGGTRYWDVPTVGQFYYNKLENALAGNYDPNQLIEYVPGGDNDREVVEDTGQGPVRIRANDGTLVYVGTRNHPAVIR